LGAAGKQITSWLGIAMLAIRVFSAGSRFIWEGLMDTVSQDIVSTGATLSNAQHPGDSDVYQWQLSSVGNIYDINASGTVGYINSTNDVDVYYVPNSVGSPDTTNNDRWIYIVTGSQPIGYDFGYSDGSNVAYDLELAQGYGPDDPNYSYVESYSGSLSLTAMYFDNNTPSDNWLFFSANGASGVKYAVASTPQAALEDYMNLASTTESLYGSGAPPPPPPPPSPVEQAVVRARGNTAPEAVSDIVLQSPSSGQVAIWEMNGINIVGGGIVADPGPAWQAIGTGEFYGLPQVKLGPKLDSAAAPIDNSDILLQNTSGQVTIWEVNGTNIIGGGTVSADPGPSWEAIGTGDFNDDRHSDILLQNTSTGQASIWEMNGTDVIGGGPVSPNPGPSWRAVGTGDFNDDGHSDILWQNTSTGQVSIWEMNGTNVIGGGALTTNPGPSWRAVGTGDFNDDGHSDILWQNTSTGQVSIWEMNGTNVIGGGAVSANPGLSWHAIGTDGGGFDILFQNTSGQMNGTSIVGGGPVSPNPGPSWRAVGLT
jgi:FG-GAP-like repeat